MKSFLTGSRVYGTPTEDSDIDLVILLEGRVETLWELAERGNFGTMKFGKLNLIVAKDEDEFNRWKIARDKCLEKAELLGRFLTRAESIKIHEENNAGYLHSLKKDLTKEIPTL